MPWIWPSESKKLCCIEKDNTLDNRYFHLINLNPARNPPVHFWKHALIFKMHHAFPVIFHGLYFLVTFEQVKVPVSKSAPWRIWGG